MDVIYWIILGALAGWVASAIMGSYRGLVEDIILGIFGAVVGGYLMQTFGQAGITGFNLYSLVVGVIGAVVLIALGRLVRRSRKLA